MTTDPIGTQPPELLEAMLAMIRREGCDAAEVTGYRDHKNDIRSEIGLARTDAAARLAVEEPA